MVIQIKKLVLELEKGSGYKVIDNEALDYNHYEEIQFVFDKENVRITRRHGYDGEEDMSSEWLDAEWHCAVPRQTMDKVLSQLISEGKAMLAPVDITETYSGRRAYGALERHTRNYTTSLEFTLKEGQKPIIELKNPKEIYDAGSL